MFSLLKMIFGGGSGVVGSIERIASEYIQTDQETAEAKALLVKVLDPNGKMRRDLSRFASRAYGFYLIVTVILIFMSVWEVGGSNCTVIDSLESCMSRAQIAASLMAELFLPITGSWAAIVSASFGVNGVNSFKGRP